MARIELPLDALELPPPPVEIQLRFQVRNNQLLLLLQSPDASSEVVGSWASSLGPDRAFSHLREGKEHRWLIFEPIPRRWADLVARFELRQVTATPEGRARVVLVGDRRHLQGLIDEVRDVDLQSVKGLETEDDVLSDRQESAVRTALAEGYYKVPRDISLTQLAEKLDLSVSSISELLRRAEGRIIAEHFGKIEVE